MKRTITVSLILASASLIILFGCAPPPAQEETVQITADQQKAVRDSLRQAQITELKITRSFAYSHYNNKNWPDAAKYYQQLAVDDTGRMFNDYGKWAHTLVQMNAPTDSVKAVYAMGLDAFPADAYLHASLGHIYRSLGQLNEAVASYEQAVQYKSDNLDYMKTLGELYVRIDEPLKAIDVYRDVLDQEPDNRNVAETLAGLIRTNLSPQEYINSLQNAVIQFPGDLDKKYELSKAYVNVLENEKAKQQLQNILAAAPQDIPALELLGNVEQNLRNPNAAIASYKKILDIEPNANIMVELSKVYREQGQYTNARTYALRALSQNSGLGAAYMAQAAIYESAADKATGGKPPKYDDQMVFLVAYGLYQKAVNSGDYTVRNQAGMHMNYLKDSKLIPAYSDWFMHQKDKDPTDKSAYDWMNVSWPELRYIETYLNQISNQ
ncbi:tetratricopeptide repeat protein [bacterium]|nr:tetratricopeptide repeat protein [bacterium]MBU1651856.1 tetratricopeptide repeat protein [bacterium]MBU1880697.1 tetratricopeptide repeat protein [bacterium]